MDREFLTLGQRKKKKKQPRQQRPPICRWTLQTCTLQPVQYLGSKHGAISGLLTFAPPTTIKLRKRVFRHIYFVCLDGERAALSFSLVTPARTGSSHCCCCCCLLSLRSLPFPSPQRPRVSTWEALAYFWSLKHGFIGPVLTKWLPRPLSLIPSHRRCRQRK